MTPYRHLQQDEIRILCLTPDSYGSPLECYLEIVSLDTLSYEQGYEAISYAWGPPLFDHKLYILDHGTIAITRTLHEAFQRLRTDRDQYRQLWVDSVCIDQSNTAERSSQVTMMGRIYSSAFSTIIWLGESESEDTLAFATISLCQEREDFNYKDSELVSVSYGKVTVDFEGAAEISLLQMDRSLVTTPCCQCCETPFTPTQNTAKHGLYLARNLLRRNWFFRLWVVQEVILSSDAYIMSGSHWVEWECFSRAMFTLYMLERDCSESLRGATSQDGWFESAAAQIQHFESFGLWHGTEAGSEEKNRARLLSSIVELSGRQCYEPRDRIYAVRSIHGMEESGDFRPDYKTDLGCLYLNLCVCYLTDKSWRQPMMPDVSLILGLVGTEDAAATHMRRPSWVPHFHYLTPRSRAKGRLYDFKGHTHDPQFISTTKGVCCRWSEENPNLLMIKARCFGVVTSLLAHSECPQRYPEEDVAVPHQSTKAILSLVQWYLRCVDFIRTHNNDLEDMRPLMSQGIPGIRGQPLITLTSEMFGTFCSSLELSEKLLDKIWHHLSPFLSPQNNDRVDRDRLLATFTIMNERHVGWVPPLTSIGDNVCIVAGAPWPLVVRSRGDDTFKLIGDAYVRGIDTFAALNCQEFGLQPVPFGSAGGGSHTPAEASAEADRYHNEQDAFSGDDPFKSLSPKDFHDSATKLDAIVELMDWLTIR